MARFELGRVTLGDIEGQGYAFAKKTVFGQTYQGIFFPDDEEALEQLRGQDEVMFSGPVYYRRRDRSARLKEEELVVAIVDSTTTPVGERADFEAVEQEE